MISTKTSMILEINIRYDYIIIRYDYISSQYTPQIMWRNHDKVWDKGHKLDFKITTYYRYRRYSVGYILDHGNLRLYSLYKADQ